MTTGRPSDGRRYRPWPLVGACAAVALVAAGLTWVVIGQWQGPPHAPAAISAPSQPLGEAVRALGASPAEYAALEELYGGDTVVPLWFAGGAVTPDGQALVDRLRGAARHGLEPTDYLVGAWRGGSVPADPAGAAAADAGLSLGVLRYMRHLHLGRVDPRTLGLRLDAWREPPAFPAVLREAARAGRAAAAVDAQAPPFVLYTQLVSALARYRALAAQPEPGLPAFERSTKPGESYAAVHALGLYLAARGDLESADVPPDGATSYDGALVAGVQRFQSRHGLLPDGVLGARTVAAAQVPTAARVQQLALALERLRWLPRLGARRLVAVNIPMFQLWAWDVHDPGAAPVFATRVIVGAARRTPTPVFVGTMDHVVFRPYWNVPMSILRGEVLPALRRDPDYLARQQMEIVRGESDDARPLALGPDSLAALAAGTLRVRQRPGPHNSLGLVKFVFPNPEGVYMHGTSAPALFARDRRDFSHGCIRVADPAGLARWALAGAAGWDDSRITAAMHGAAPRRVDLAAPVDVVLFYMTAAVVPEDGAVHFADDIYGYDAALASALAAASWRR